DTVVGSSATDDDAISVILAFVRDGGVNHTLSAFRTQGGYAFASGWGIAYYQNSTPVLTVATGSAGPVFKNPDETGWSNRMSRILIERTGDTFKATASDFGLDSNHLPLNPASLLTVDLNSDPLLEIFKGPKPYGSGSFSQADSYFDQAQIVGGLDPQYIYDLVNDRVYVYDNHLGYVVVSGVDPYDQLGYPREVTNPDTGKTYLLNRDKTYTLLP
ncbi:MAG TPA: hypothetical protein PL182_06830, partial [Pseudobdellovibrionaceae bacterium]|nr:hypothetical protein [Pseudobdellovibrionaceae bacterium]